MNYTESEIQQACVKACDEYFSLRWPGLMIELEDSKKRKYKISPLVATPNEANSSIQAGVRRKRMGVRSGYPDLKLEIQSGKYHGLYIEMKKPKEKQTRNQVS